MGLVAWKAEINFMDGCQNQLWLPVLLSRSRSASTSSWDKEDMSIRSGNLLVTTAHQY